MGEKVPSEDVLGPPGDRSGGWRPRARLGVVKKMQSDAASEPGTVAEERSIPKEVIRK